MPTPQRSPKSVIIRGWLLVACGVLLVAVMAVVMASMYSTLTHVGHANTNGSTFTGTAAQAEEILRLFYAVIAFGVMTLLIGIYQVTSRSQSRVAYFLMIAGAAGLLYLAKSVTTALG